MATKFTIISFGAPGDDGPSGECGIRVEGVDGEFRSELTLYCPESHTHSKDCAQALLDAKIMPDGVTLKDRKVEEELESADAETGEVSKKKVEKTVQEHVANPKISPREVMKRYFSAKREESKKLSLASKRHDVESPKTNELV